MLNELQEAEDAEPDLFLDILQNEQLGLIEYSIGLPVENEYFAKIFEKYDDGGLEIG